MSENTTEPELEEKPIEGDRPPPSVGKNKTENIAIFIIILLAASAIIFFIIQPNEKEDEESKTAEAPVEFSVPKTTKPQFAPIPPSQSALLPPTNETAPRGANQNDPLSQHEIAMREQAFKIAQEQKAAMDKRLRADSVVFDESVSPRDRKSGKQLPPPRRNHSNILLAGNNTALSDEEKWAKEKSNEGFNAVTATQVHNLGSVILQGKMIAGVLETAINSQICGMLRAAINEDVYSYDGSNLLIPKGSRAIGQCRSARNVGDTRLYVIWNRVITPGGVSIALNSQGSDELGRAGVTGYVDSRFMERFGSALLLTLIDGALDIAAESIKDDDSAEITVDSGSDLSGAAEIALENSVNLRPIIHVPQGTKINIFVQHDLDFSRI